jgi:polyketide synthase 12
VEQHVVPLGRPRAERSDAVRNRRHLLSVARAVLAEHDVVALTMDGLAERAGLGKGTVFRRFGSRAGIFRALLEDEEHEFQKRVLAGPPPLGPGATPLDRLIAYGEARIGFMARNFEIARAAVDCAEARPAGAHPLSQIHIRMLLGHLNLGSADLDMLALQLTAALDGPLLLYLSAADLATAGCPMERRVVCAWRDLVHRVCRPHPD